MSSLQQSYREIAGRASTTTVRYLTDDGTGITGNRNATGNYSVTPQDFFVGPPGSEVWIVKRIGGVISGLNNASLADYGSISGGLTQGLRFFLEVAGQEIDITASSNHKTNVDLLANGNVGYELNYGGNDKLDQFFLPTIADTDTIRLDGRLNMKLILRLNDDFSALANHTFFAHFENLGRKEA